MNTLFFQWRDVAHLIVAQDPIEDDQRWVIRQSKQSKNPEDLELLKVKNGKVDTVSTSISIDYLKWQAVLVRLNHINDLLHRAPYLLDKTMKNKMQAFLWIISDTYECGLQRQESSRSSAEWSCST